MTSEACAKSEQNLKIPKVKEAEILIGNNFGLRGNWVPYKFSYLEGVCVCVCVCVHSDNVVTGLMTARTIWDISVAESTEQAFPVHSLWDIGDCRINIRSEQVVKLNVNEI